MECPFELPVEKKPDSKEFEGLWIVVDKVGMIIGFPLKDFEADYIVQAINSHEKLVKAIKGAMRIKDLWYFQSREPQYQNESEALEIMRSMFKQALKEAEKP